MTGWMVDRMRRVALESSDPAVIEATRGKLCEEVRSRVVEGNVLRLEGIEGIAVTRFSVADVVRHPIVGRIVEAYEGPGH